MSSKKLLIELVKLARRQATEQLDDVWHPPALTDIGQQGSYHQLDTRDHAGRGGRFRGEPYEAPGVNRDNREGEYKFWDEANLKMFWRIDGMPTAARALLFSIRECHKISEAADVWMSFVGIIDEALGPSSSHRIRLQSILGPLKLWDQLPKTHPDFEKLLERTGGHVSADYCHPFWPFALQVVRNAPHMLKPGYIAQRNRKVQRFSWARLLVLLFLPETVLMRELAKAGLVAENPPIGWHQRARKQMKDMIATHARAKLCTTIEHGWDDLCRELDKLYFEHNLSMDDSVPNSPVPSNDDQQDLVMEA